MYNNNNGILGNSIDIKMDPCNPAVEIRADVKVEEFMTKRIWGQILNCHNQPVPNTLIKLVKIINEGCHNKKYVGIAHTVTDCEGFYQFDVCADDVDACYKIIVNKAVTGDETVIETGGGNCNACGITTNPNTCTSSYDPCTMPEQTYMPYRPCDNVRPQKPHNCYCEPKHCSSCQKVNYEPKCNDYEQKCYDYEPKCGCNQEQTCYVDVCKKCYEPKCGCKCKKHKNNYASYTR